MENLKIFILLTIFFIIVFSLSRIDVAISKVLKFMIKMENYKLSISRGTNDFINLYKEKICKFIETNYNEKDFEQDKMLFNYRFDKAVRSSVNYVNRPTIFLIIECLVKRTTNEQKLINGKFFYKEFTNIISELNKRINLPEFS